MVKWPSYTWFVSGSIPLLLIINCKSKLKYYDIINGTKTNWLSCLVWVKEIAGSRPAVPNIKLTKIFILSYYDYYYYFK